MDNTIIINGQPFDFTPGETILQVARRVGIHIPTLCYLKDAFPTGACRICVVEIQGTRGLVSACSTPAVGKMEVSTDSPNVVRARKTVVELLMISGNHNCAARGTFANEWTDYQEEVRDYDHAEDICVAYGKCELQALAYKYMVTGRTIDRIPTQYPLENDDPLIGRDFSRCILCGRCVQACTEVQVNNAISHGYRGNVAKIVVRGDKTLPDSECVYCGECLQVCPVGALFEKRSRFDTRIWEVETLQTTCHYCGVGCQLELSLKDNKILKINGVEDAGPNYGRLCFKGRFAFDFLSSPHRLTTPMVKKEGELTPVSWEEALDVIRDRLNETVAKHGPGAVGGFVSPKYTNEDLFAVNEFFNNAAGPDRLVHFEPPAFNAPDYSKIKDADVIVVVENDINSQHPTASSFIKQAARRSARLVVVHPGETRDTVLAQKADVLLTDISRVEKEIEPGQSAILVYQPPMDTTPLKEIKNLEIYSIPLENNTMGAHMLGIPAAAEIDLSSLKFIYTMGFPVQTTGAPAFLVVQDIFSAHWHKDADVLLPAAVWVEYAGTYTSAGGGIETVNKAVEPPGEAKPTQWIFRELSQRLGHTLIIPPADQMGKIPPPEPSPVKMAPPDGVTRPDFQRQLYLHCEGVQQAVEKNVPGGE